MCFTRQGDTLAPKLISGELRVKYAQEIIAGRSE
jgi:hypothetical protein